MARGLIARLGLIAGMAASWQAGAQDMRLDSRTFVERVQTDINGRPRRTIANAERAMSGDQLIVVVDWRHEGSRTAHGLTVVRQVPRGTLLDPTDPAMQASVDGGAHWGRLDQLWLPTPLGGVRRATPEDITHIRWRLPDSVAPGQSGRLTYRAQVR